MRAAQLRADWLPEFCQGSGLLAVAVLAQLVACVATLVPVDTELAWLPRLALISLYAQGVGLTSAALVCASRRWLLRWPLWVEVLGILGLVTLVTLLVAQVAWSFSQVLDVSGAVPMRPWRFLSGTLAVTLLVAAAALRYGWVHQQWRLQVQAAARAELEALQARIRPHFLFNSMNTIASLIRIDPRRAERVVEDLSELFRAVLTGDRCQHPLADEIELLQRYLDIEALRLGDRLRLDLHFADLPARLPVPPLILQPLVENAVYHGVQPLPEGGCVRIRGARVPGGYRICIENPRPAFARGGGHGIAQRNVALRLGYALGPAARLEATESPEHYSCSVLLPIRAALPDTLAELPSRQP
ncbi:MAG: histidine kinase [Xanthomonadales bacterium]|jgi:two-component system sensor histidine kinase AlgZ|nr:histidine kinase [Xanthomonadales bacterium]